MKYLLEVIIAVILIGMIIMTLELNIAFDRINDIENWLHMPVVDEVEG